MASKTQFSFKRIQIDKATRTMIIFISVATGLLVFSLVASRALLSQRSYLSKVIAQKETAKQQLEANIEAKDQLVESYKRFTDTEMNVIGGNPNGTGQNDGDNATVILNALPSQYDFPALTNSLEKMLSYDGLSLAVDSVSGTDDEIAQSQIEVETPEPIEMPFELDVSGSYDEIQKLIGIFERSTRPFNISALSLTGSDATMRMSITAKTYYQPEKKVNIQEQVVR